MDEDRQRQGEASDDVTAQEPEGEAEIGKRDLENGPPRDSAIGKRRLLKWLKRK